MQPQASSIEGTLRRLHLRSSSDPDILTTGRLDGSSQNSPTSISPIHGETFENDHASEVPRKVHPVEQAMKRNKVAISYFLGALLSLLLLIQIITGGFRLVENPLKIHNLQLPIGVAVVEEKQVARCAEEGLKDGRSMRETSGVSSKCNESREEEREVHKSLWSEPNSKYRQCVQRSRHQTSATEATNGYLMAFANGGLNQMRTAICDMVAVARVLNATLVIPELDHTSYWDDPSNFDDIFDVDHFIKQLQDDVKIVKELPSHINRSQVHHLAPKSWSDVQYYKNEILPLLKKHKALRFTLTDSRLSNNRVPAEIQRLRCRAYYKALRFQADLRTVGRKIIKRLQTKGSYIALHLRYEKDMLAFSGCTAGLSSHEADYLRQIRYNTSRWKEKEINAVSRRAEGRCPLTPHEIGLLLKAMGCPQNTTVYVAAGKIYGGKTRMKTFTSFFPNVVTKETATTKEEFEPFRNYQNRLAAIDYMVSMESDLFVPTYDGNMAKAVEGHRRFEGHKKTLIPDRTQLVRILDDFEGGKLDWKTVEMQVQKCHENKQGHPQQRRALPPSQVKLEDSFYANPFPGCICEVEVNNGTKLHR